MTVPKDYRRASEQFDDLLKDAAVEAGLETRNQAYTMLQGVLQVFRRRLEVQDAINFAQVLPPLPRALFIENWEPGQALSSNWDPSALSREVQQLRVHHNFSPDTAIQNVAAALRKHVDQTEFTKCLVRLPPEARAFWEK